MSLGRSNFDFLQSHSPQLVKLGVLAERYFHDDPPGSLGKLRQFGEFLAKEIAAQHAVLPAGQPSFDDILRALKAGGVNRQRPCGLCPVYRWPLRRRH
jgi:type I restriction enzyme R subunit